MSNTNTEYPSYKFTQDYIKLQGIMDNIENLSKEQVDALIDILNVIKNANTYQTTIDSLNEKDKELEDKMNKIETTYASSTQYGLVKTPTKSGIVSYNGELTVNTNSQYGTSRTGDGKVVIASATNADIDTGVNNYKPIVPSNLDYAVNSIVGGKLGKISFDVDGGIAIGKDAKTTYNNVAVGVGADGTSGGSGHVIVGSGVQVNGEGCTAVGAGSSAGGVSSVALGNGANASGNFACQIGSGENDVDNTVKLFSYRLTSVDDDGAQFLTDVGELSNLSTVNKTNIVEAVNEVNDLKRNKYSEKPVRIGTWIDDTPIWRTSFDTNLTSLDMSNKVFSPDLCVKNSSHINCVLNSYVFTFYKNDNAAGHRLFEEDGRVFTYVISEHSEEGDPVRGYVDFVTPESNLKEG